MKSERHNQIHSILSEVLNMGLLPADNPKRNELAAWDSLKHMELILRLEEQFQIRFTIREVAEIQSLQDIVEIIEVKS